MNPTHSDYISRTRNAATKLIEAVDELRALDKQRAALDLGNMLDNGTRDDADADDVQFGDFLGTNSSLTVADINAVTTTLGNIETMLAAGNATNLYKVKK